MIDYRLLVGVVLGLVLAPCPANADTDAMSLRLREAYRQDLRWDNIEDAPEWLNGVKPDYDERWRMHRVLLGPGQQTAFLLPAYQSLRLYHPEQTLNGSELDVLVSDGTGLAAQQTPQISADGHSLLLSPQSSAPLLIHLNRPDFKKQSLAVAAFVSRREPLDEIAPYRELLATSARSCRLTQDPFTWPERYERFPAFARQGLDVTGPARLQIKHRLDYERQAGELIQDYRIRYWLDDAPEHWLDFSTSLETSRVITVDAAVEVVGRERQTYLEIPAGKHRIALQTDRPLFAQVLAQTENDYLFKSLNQPRLPVEDIRRQGLLPNTALAEAEHKAYRIARDNSRQAGGMAAAQLLREAALKRQDYPEGLTEAEQLRGFRSFYRNLLPSAKTATDRQFFAYFMDPAITATNRPQNDEALLPDQHWAEALKRLSGGYFNALKGVGEAAANRYTLPEQPTDGSLRLIVDNRRCLPRLLQIAFDQQPPRDLQLRCGPDLAPDAFNKTITDAALAGLRQAAGGDNVSLTALFSSYQQPAPLIDGAIHEFALPKNTRAIKIWLASGQQAEPVHLALQYRAAKPFLLSEQSYLALLRYFSGRQAGKLFCDAVIRPCWQPLLAEPLPAQELANEWLPLQRLLQAEYLSYKSSVSAYPIYQTNPPAGTPNPNTVIEERRLAEQSERQNQWLEALEHWEAAANHGSRLNRQQAQLAQATALTELGEDYLAERLLRYLSLYADRSVAETAYRRLREQYLAQNDDAALLTLTAAIHSHCPSPEHARHLFDALLKNGEYRFALLLGLHFSGPERPITDLLLAAYQLDWRQTYQWLQEQLPPSRQAFWTGLQAQRRGDYDAALKLWSQPEILPWHDYLQQGLDLRAKFRQSDGRDALSLYRQWAAWQQNHPGGRRWQNALWQVVDYAGGDSYYAIERDIHAQAVRATASRPVRLAVLGPVTLNLQIRPLHPPARPDSALDGWLRIDDNRERRQFPFTNNLPSQGLSLTGADNLQPGIAFNLVYQVGQGLHDIALYSEQAPLSIGIQEQRPELPITVLPVLNADTFAAMAANNREQQTDAARRPTWP